VDTIIEYRKLDTLNNFFVRPYQTHMAPDGLLHPTYNQLLQTGRMGCSEPNMQQLDKTTKELVHPRAGMAFLSIDWSQIEFRLIVHYIQDEEAIKAYNTDPDTDFHQWVADVCGMARKPAKNVNFMMGYGGGKGKCVRMLSQNTDVIGKIIRRVDEDVASGVVPEGSREQYAARLCAKKAEEVYNTYHSNLPTLKSTSRNAASIAEHRGYVRTLFGRRRHLAIDRAWLAFNTANQGSAADMMKERLVALHRLLRGTPLHIAQVVHDEVLIEGPVADIYDDRTVRDLINLMEHPNIELRIPVRCSYGRSKKNWREAGAEELKLKYDPSAATELTHLHHTSST
jgi:DNA polymerase-1